MFKNSVWLWAVCVGLLTVSPALSQTIGTGGFDGRVVDATGAVLPGVTVTLTHVETGLTRTVVTDDNGRFRVPLLPVGPYTLTAELPGFQTLQRSGLILTIGQQQSLGDISIEVATVEEVITVTAESPLIETARSVTAATFDSREIENLPIAGRDYKNFALNTPNVVTASPTSGRTTINLGGMKGIDTNITVDGADFNNTFFGSATGQPEVPYYVVSQEAVEEFQVLANGYSAEFGRSGGGFLNVVTKSGTNDIHGSGFFFGRNDKLRSTLTDGTGRELSNAAFSQQQFGGSLGGPIVTDKAHYFFAVDRQGFDRPVRLQYNRDVTGVCNTQIYGQTIGGVDCLSDEEGETAELLDNTAVLAKVDFQLNDTNTLSVRYNFSDFTGENFFSTAGGGGSTVQAAALNGTNLEANTAHSFVVSNTTVIGVDKFNEVRFQYSFEERPRLGQSNDLPTVVINDTGRFGRQWFLPITSDHKRLQLTDNFTYLFGNHDLKVGGDLNLTDTSQAFYGWGGGYYAFNTLEDYINGRPNQFTQRVGINGFSTPESGTISLGQEELALYVNDTWRPNPGLTLNLGVRWEAQWNPTAPEQTDGKQSRNPADPGLDTIGLVQGDIPNDLNNIAPRFGFAWDPGNDGRTVVRGGAGLFYSRANLLLMANSFTANGYRQALFFLFGNQIPEFPFVYPESGLPPDDPLNDSLPVTDIAFFDDQFKNARTARANFGVEHEILDEFSVGADYVYARTTDDHRRTNRNIPQPPIGFDEWGRGLYDGSRVDPAYNQFQVEEASARRQYNAFTASMRKRFAGKYQFQAFYTLSQLKTDDDNERDSSGFRNTQPENLDADWGDSENDIRHRFVASAVFNLPVGFVFSTLVQTNTGRPFNVISGRDDNGDRNTNDYAVINDSNRARAQAAGQDLPDGLVKPRAGRQPSSFLMDIRVSKVFDFGRPGNIELLFEVFNLFNNANRLTAVGTTGSSIGSPNFGFLNLVGDPRQVQLGARYRW
ncbi:MAG TPA: carboxypeptidase regulatory-like domain-containing protein [Vicinamibacteria bacterium]|nr:carboxypeptidase regulatory-like domain-containing protein [Vicinamibacteria bacterium]